VNPQKIGVIGAGLMGHGIAYLLAAAGHTVDIYDPSAEWRNSLRQRLESARDLLDGDPALLDRISAHDQVAPAMKDASFVFEAAPEKLALKQQLFALIQQIRTLSPETRIVLMSAHPPDVMEQMVGKIQVDGYLEKPISIYKLWELVASVISNPSQLSD
jgi:3-hydroxybutyryl-CoA dehydrogenase